MDKTDFGDRMKMYEGVETQRKLMPMLPICVRLDGNSFSKFTKGLKRPYDTRLSDMMIEVTKKLVDLTNATVGYTQSDEISLVIYSDNIKSQTFFNGKIHKLNSILASKASVWFNKLLVDAIPEKADACPVFDCRVWNVPTKIEAANTILWREQDATKNSISMAASHYFSHKSLQNKNGKDMKDMLINDADVNWNKYPPFFKRGTFIQRYKELREWTAEEVAEIKARSPKATLNVGDSVVSSVINVVDMPPFDRVVNRVGVVFEGEEPIEDRG